MTITKNQKMLLGVGALAVAGYLVYQQMNKNNMVGFIRPRQMPPKPRMPMPISMPREIPMPRSISSMPRGNTTPTPNSGYGYGSPRGDYDYGGEGIPQCPQCNRSGKCNQVDILGNGTVVDCRSSDNYGYSGGYGGGSYSGRTRKK